MVIKWTDSAILDLKEFYNYSKKDDVNNYIVYLVNTTNMLLQYPKIGKVIFRVQEYIIRQLIIKEHKILYYNYHNNIHIIAAIYYKQNFQIKINYIKKFLNNL